MKKEMQKLVQKLKDNYFEAEVVENGEQAKKKVLELIKKGSSVGYGGSMSLETIGIFEELKKGNYDFIDWENENKEKRVELRRKSLSADYYLSSTNAITMDGELVNVDGHGNRVGALCFGPKKVILVVGKNKIVKNIDEGIKRIKNTAAPLNTKRLNKKTPCAKTGKCENCRSPDRICDVTVIHTFQNCSPQRIHVILVNEKLGF